MDSETRTPTLDEMFQGMPIGNTQPGGQPKYAQYAERFRSMTATHRPRMIVPALLIVVVVLLFGGVGVYMVRTWNDIPAAPMSAAQAFTEATQPEFVPDPSRIYTATGQAVGYNGQWFCPIGNVYGTVIDVTDWLREMDHATPEQRARYSIDNGGCVIWTP